MDRIRAIETLREKFDVKLVHGDKTENLTLSDKATGHVIAHFSEPNQDLLIERGFAFVESEGLRLKLKEAVVENRKLEDRLRVAGLLKPASKETDTVTATIAPLGPTAKPAEPSATRTAMKLIDKMNIDLNDVVRVLGVKPPVKLQLADIQAYIVHKKEAEEEEKARKEAARKEAIRMKAEAKAEAARNKREKAEARKTKGQGKDTPPPQ